MIKYKLKDAGGEKTALVSHHSVALCHSVNQGRSFVTKSFPDAFWFRSRAKTLSAGEAAVGARKDYEGTHNRK